MAPASREPKYKPMTTEKRQKPLVIFDGDCAFCRLWIRRTKSYTGDRLDFVPYQEVEGRFPDIPRSEFVKAMKLILPDGRVLSGAHAAFTSISSIPGRGWLLWLYTRVRPFAVLSEAVYARIARNRPRAYRLTRLIWGKTITRPSYRLSRWLFLRALGVVYFIAFLSFWTQMPGLIGGDGIVPAQGFLDAVSAQFGIERYWTFPTLAWLNGSDLFLETLMLVGALLSIVLIIGFLQAPILIFLWVAYLSIFTVGQPFMGFQWDILLLESGFLAIFLAPWRVLPSAAREGEPSSVVLWLYRFLLFRLIFSSGVVKLASGDETWRNLSAMSFHYETQPLPNPISWYMHQLPDVVHRVSTVGTFAAELAVPFLIFMPRRIRFVGGAAIIAFMGFVALTGNYTFFNLLTVALCILLFDDFFVGRFLPKRMRKAETDRKSILGAMRKKASSFVLAVFVVLIVGAGFFQIGAAFSKSRAVMDPARQLMRWIRPFHIINGYGLFAVMTTRRPEIVIEGSDNGREWKTYEFKYKPGDPGRPPPWAAPHQPRLDWQMWFAALGSYEQNPWFSNLILRLLEGSPDVLQLLARNPFPANPPKFIRAIYYEYHFTDSMTSSDWWTRDVLGLYMPVVSLGDGDGAASAEE